MRHLIVTADDFGLSADVNAAVIEGHRDGIVTAASLMIAGAARDEAIALARAHPTLRVGLHLVLVDGKSTLPPEQIPDLVSPEGDFPASPLAAGLRYQFSSRVRRQLALEIAAQLTAFRQTGLVLAHVDGHHHLHLHPVVLSILSGLAAEYGIPAIRLPAEELRTAVALDPRRAARDLVWSGVFRALRRAGERRLRRAGVLFADRVYGLHATGQIDEDYLLRLVPRMRGRRVELYAHPSRSPAGSGLRERAALVSPRVRAAIHSAGFALGPEPQP